MNLRIFEFDGINPNPFPNAQQSYLHLWFYAKPESVVAIQVSTISIDFDHDNSKSDFLDHRIVIDGLDILLVNNSVSAGINYCSDIISSDYFVHL
jgi:hypothetical protein